MPSSIVTLGGFTFRGHEVPEHIPFGGRQILAKHTLIGGQRVTDAMGWEPTDPAWSGRFRGSDALSRARSVERIAQRGGQVPLSWGGIRLTVVIEEFEPDYRRSIDIPYRIRCYVTDSRVGGLGSGTPIDTLVGGDLSGALGLMGGAFTAGPAGALGALSDAIGVVGSVAGAPIGALSPIQDLALGAVGALDTAVAVADGVIGAALSPDPALLPGEGFAQTLLAQNAALTAQDALLRARGLAGRVAVNLYSTGV